MRQNNWKCKKNRWMAVSLSLILCAALLCPVPVSAEETDDSAIHIKTQDDLKELADHCRLDTWSQGKTVVLDADLKLDKKAKKFLPIPSFGGTFDGGGHVVSGFCLDGDDSRAGLFDTLQSDGVVKNLSVEGQVAPTGDGDTIGGLVGINYGKIVECSFEGTIQGSASVGGLAGVNETTGQITNSKFQGSVTGEHYVGGIAGQNTGSLIQCENSGDVNTTAVEVSVDFADLSVLGTTESVPAGTDIGGIAGFSSGVVQSCKNAGNVGYDHMGYNVGGVTGRQSGYLDGCSNTGQVKGRKDVGGIVGQLEPQVTLRYDEDLLDRLGTELDNLQNLTNQAAADAQAGSSTLSGSVNGLLSDISSAKDAVSGLSGAITDWGKENVGQINDVSARLSWAISQMEPILDSTNRVSDALKDASALLEQAAETAAGTGEQGASAAEELKQASQDLQDAAACTQNCTAHVKAAVEIAESIINGEQSEDAVQSMQDELNAAKTEAQNGETLLENAISHVETAKNSLGESEDGGSEVLDSLTQAADSINSAGASAGEILDQITAVATQLAEQPAVSFSPVDSNVASQGDALDGALSQVLQSASGLQGSLSSSSDTLLNDFQAINHQVGVITDLLKQQLNETEEKNVEDSVEDVSDADAGDASSGKIRGSANSGKVAGDVNVAGIAGSLSVEYDFDPEDDLTEEGSRSLDFQCKTLAVVTGCTNEGSVCAKKNYTGGIVGRMDLGAVKTCESYGNVESTNGDYVGGIAGLSRATIRNCFAKCTLSGGNYVGGIIGNGEENSVVSDCYTLVDIQTSGSGYGAISGTETGEFSGNCFVSDTLAGLGRISYAGKAEPIDFSSFSQVSGMPEKMTQFTLRFLVEDEEVESRTFSYGDSFGEDVFPDIPVKDGCYAKWDTDDLSDLHFDKTVKAEYERYVLTLASSDSRNSGRSIFFMDGDFDDDAGLKVSEVKDPGLIHGKSAKEAWKLTCSDSSQDSYTVRYLSPDETPEGYAVFVKQEGKWKKADCTTFGSYLVFSVPAAETEVAVVTSASVWIQRVGIVLLILILLGVCGTLAYKQRKKKIMSSEGIHKKTGTFSFRKTKREKDVENVLTASIQKEGKKKKWWLVPAAVMVVAGILSAVFLCRKMGAAAEACELLQNFTEQSEYAVSLSIDAKLDGRLTDTDMDMTKTEVDGHSVTGIQADGITLYYAEGAILMENGKAYKISDLHPDYTRILTEAARMYRKLSFTTKKGNGNTVYCLTAEGDYAKDVLSLLLPGQAEHLSDTQKVEVELAAAEDEIQSLTFTSEGTLLDQDKTPYTLSAELTPEQIQKGYQIPEPVKETVCSGEIEDRMPITEDLFRLVSAWTNLQNEETFSADFTMGAQCGPITLNEDMQYDQVRSDAGKIQAIRKGDFVLYFSDGVFCDQNGTLLNADENETIDRAHLLEVVNQICMNGEFDCTDTGNDTWLYTLTMDEEAMKEVAYAAVPEMESMNVTLKEGSIQISVKDTGISEITCSCTGGLDALADAAPVTVSADLVYDHNSEAEIPDAVRKQLEQKGVEEDGK